MVNLRKVLVEKENFISNDLCDFFINYHNINPHEFKHRNTSIISCENESYAGNLAFKFLLKKLNFFVENFAKNTFVNYSQIVKWPPGESQDTHIDFDYHTYTSILYLNDQYEGGFTVVADKIIKPKKGKIVLFDGNKTEHRVLPITFGTRYTNATWYVTKTEQEVLQ
tara:strand:- start:141 stop:641 length:501 start_codon:yes stop_codon:yes gene_type:complete